MRHWIRTATSGGKRRQRVAAEAERDGLLVHLPEGRAGRNHLGGGHLVELLADRAQHLRGEPVNLFLDRPLVVGETRFEAGALGGR